MNPLISIIIPVYNAADYIRHCANSILSQSYEDFEIILVNDGSTDGSAGLTDDLAIMDSRIKVVHQQNQGVSAARNAGLSLANGEYVLFVDSDDWIADHYLEGLLEDIISQDVDIVDQSFERIHRDGSIEAEKYVNSKLRHKEIEKWIEMLVVGHTGPFPKIFRNAIIRDHRLSFDTSLSLCEDLVFILQYMQYADKGIYYSDKSGYYYRQIENSLGNSFLKKNMSVTYHSLRKILEVLNNDFYARLCKHRDDLEHLRNKIIGISMFFVAVLHNNSSRKERIEALKTLKSYELDYYWEFIKVRNPIRRLFYWLFEKNCIRLAVFVEDIRKRMD